MVIKQNKGYKLPLSKLEIIQKYKKGFSMYEIAKLCNCTPQTIFHFLKQAGVKSRSLSVASTTYKHDTHYFDKIDTEDKAYFLGLLHADGNITKNLISISLQESDKYILRKFKNFVKYTGPLYFRKKSDIRENQWLLSITSTSWKESLLKHGLFPNKGFKLTFPKTVPNHLIHHFIRGYFDGDGCVYVNKKNYDYLFSIIATKQTLTSIQNILIKNLKLNKTKLIIRKTTTNNTLSIMTYQGRISVLKIREYLYKDATIWLPRKYKKFFSIELPK